MNVLKSLLTVSGFTLLSRVTGLIREVLVARAFGASGLTDAFNVAFRLPNLLRRLFAEGAFSQAFIPILSEYYHKQGKEPTKILIQNVAIVLFWALLLVVLIGIIGASYLVAAMASGFSEKKAIFDQAVIMTRIMFPYIACMSFVAMASGVLQIFGRFAIPAFTPVLLNLSFIAVALIYSQSIQALAWAVVLGGVLQLAIQLPALHKLGMLPPIHRHIHQFYHALKHPGVLKILKQMLPATLAVSVSQISLIINTNIASHLVTGSVSWLSYADRLMEFPSAMLGVALSTILMPLLSKARQLDDPLEYSRLLDWGLQLVLLMSLPAALALYLYGLPLSATLFHYGKFSTQDVEMTRQALSFYGVGLLGLIAVKILAPGFYAQQDIKTPVKIGLCVLVLTQLLNYIFVPLYQHAGLALSIGLGALANALLLWLLLRHKKIYQTQYHHWSMFIIKVLIACASVAGLMYFFAHYIDWLGLQKHAVLRMVYLLGSVALIALVYIAVLRLQGIHFVRYLKKSQV